MSVPRLRFTLDTSSVIHAVQNGQYGPEIADLVALGQAGAVHLYLTGAFEVDMERASELHLTANIAWLQNQTAIERIPQPARFDFSTFDDPGHGFVGDEHLEPIKKLESFMLPAELQPGQFDPAIEPDKQEKFRRKVADVQHLAGHLMSGNDYFVTSDEDDMLRPTRKRRIFEAASIRVVDPLQALEIARRSGSVGP